MSKVVTFGEIMLRLAPNGYYRFFQDDQMQATFGGGEANVAVSLANFGLDSIYVTKLPDHAIGQAAVNSLLPPTDPRNQETAMTPNPALSKENPTLRAAAEEELDPSMIT